MSRELRNGQKCQALDCNERKCSRAATHYYSYHGDAELYDHFDNKPTWVRVALCEKHRCSKGKD